MSNATVILVILVLGGCAARSQIDTTTHHYDCAGTHIVATGATLQVRDQSSTSLLQREHHDDDGDHFKAEHVEYVVPIDRRGDVAMRTPVTKAVCVADGGYTDALQRFMRSGSHHDVALQLQLDDDGARNLIHEALRRIQHNYYRDR